MLRKVDKISKIVATILLVVMILAMVGTSVFATWDVSITPETNATGVATIQSIGGNVVGIMQVVGYVIAVVILVYIGIKWVTSSPEGKAEVKKIALYYVLGSVVIATAVTIVGIVFNFGAASITK